MSLLLLCQFSILCAQDTATLNKNALYYADSLIKASFGEDWNTYLELSNPTAIKYYGGKEGYKEHAKMIYYRITRQENEKREKLRMVQLMNDGTDQWQCVIEKERNTFIDNRKVKILSHVIGQSTDNGDTWKFVDIAHNSTENIIYVMPALFSNISVPPGKMLYEDELLAQQQQQEAAAQQAAAKKKTTNTGAKKMKK
ncbi:MAG: hypothetical protein QM731_12045 [Chitinophagaceae bacterium]